MQTVTLLLLLSPAWDTAAEMPLCWPNEACVCEVTTPSTIYLTQRIKQLTTAYSMDAELHLTATDVVNGDHPLHAAETECHHYHGRR